MVEKKSEIEIETEHQLCRCLEKWILIENRMHNIFCVAIYECSCMVQRLRWNLLAVRAPHQNGSTPISPIVHHMRSQVRECYVFIRPCCCLSSLLGSFLVQAYATEPACRVLTLLFLVKPRIRCARFAKRTPGIVVPGVVMSYGSSNISVFCCVVCVCSYG